MGLSDSQQSAVDRALLALSFYEATADDDARLRGSMLQEYGRDYVLESMLALVSLLVVFNVAEDYTAGMTVEEIAKLSVRDIRKKILALVARAESSE